LFLAKLSSLTKENADIIYLCTDGWLRISARSSIRILPSMFLPSQVPSGSLLARQKSPEHLFILDQFSTINMYPLTSKIF